MSHSRDDADALLADTVRREASSVVAFLYRLTGDFDVAEEAVQEALVSALHSWRRDGLPDVPGAWLTTAAKHRAVDLLRRRARQRRLEGGLDAPLDSALDGPLDGPSWSDGLPGPADADDRVPMLFGCCHPALAVEARLALTLRAVVGLTTARIAAAFLVPEPTVAQRIVRAKRKIGSAGIPLAIPGPEELPARLDDVLTVVCLAYTAAFLAPSAAGKGGLAADAGWLAELVCATLPGEPEAWGLLGLLTLQQARARARFDADGSLVLLPDQDRSRWDHRAIASAERYLERAAVWRRPGRFQLHAAIAACHASAPTWAETDWLQILTLYDVLVRYDGSPVIRLNRAVALMEYAGPERALHEVDALAPRLSGYHLLHATRAEMLRRLARTYERPSAVALAEADAGWVTMHGPKIEHKRRQGEINAAMACGGGTEQLAQDGASTA